MIDSFNNICLFRQKNPGYRGSGVPVSNPILNFVKDDLIRIQEWLENRYQNYKGVKLRFEHSKGQTLFPSIMHVSILPPGQEVSNGIYVVICFDIEGRGALIGCAESKTNPKGLKTINRSAQKHLTINVNGLRDTTRYNDVFENPKEFYAFRSDLEEIEAHITESLELCLYHLHFIDNPELYIEPSIDSDNLYSFNPNEVNTVKEKVERYVTIRHGQQKFKEDLLKSYNYKCAVTGCNVIEVLQASHIVPYNGKETNHIQNGIILRVDIHNLFDSGLITIDPDTYKVIVSNKLRSSLYYEYNGKKILLPEDTINYPSREALRYRMKDFI